jgi:hypothetical protein
MHEDILDAALDGRTRTSHQDADALPVPIPEGHIGPVILPGTGRMIWWTGRVAIGLRHQPQRRFELSQSALWVQNLMLAGKRRAAA